tara:strand:- start:24 stop:266 length:243 start_codon:yes stop_codon:yes gene_type:complete
MLIIEENKYEYKYIMKGSRKKLKDISYEPAIGIVPAKTNENSWRFNKGKWSETSWKNNNESMKKYRNKYNQLAIELTLTN